MICLQHPFATRDEVRDIPLARPAGWSGMARARIANITHRLAPITRLKPNLKLFWCLITCLDF